MAGEHVAAEVVADEHREQQKKSRNGVHGCPLKPDRDRRQRWASQDPCSRKSEGSCRARASRRRAKAKW